MITIYSHDENLPNSFQYSEEVLNAINFNLHQFPPHKLELQKNQRVVLLINLDPTRGLCTGTKLRIVNANKFILKCTYAQGKTTYIPKVEMRYRGCIPIAFLRVQFPIQICPIKTFHKIQGLY